MILVFWKQFLFDVPKQDCLIGLCSAGGLIFSALVFLIYRADICTKAYCQWGKGASSKKTELSKKSRCRVDYSHHSFGHSQSTLSLCSCIRPEESCMDACLQETMDIMRVIRKRKNITSNNSMSRAMRWVVRQRRRRQQHKLQNNKRHDDC